MLGRQLEFRPPLPEILGCKDFLEKRALFEQIDAILRRSRLDELFVRFALEEHSVPSKNRERFLRHSFTAFRCCLVRYLEGNLPVRQLSNALAESHLLQWFCHLGNFGAIKVPSKSTLDRYERWISTPKLDRLIERLIALAAQERGDGEGHQVLGLNNAMDMSEAWIDGTCLKANLHFPTDWVLLLDAGRTLMKACEVIRCSGLRNRMPKSPKAFLREVNKLGIAMSQQRRQKDSKKNRKRILRQLKALLKRLRRHGQKHRDLLQEHWSRSGLTWRQANQVIGRIDGVLERLPLAVKQAHERLIGERQVKSNEKILSLYDEDVRVIVRGKLGAEVEFGNVWLLGEQKDGLILEWTLYRDTVSEVKLTEEAVERINERVGGRMRAIGGDRGFHSKANEKALEGRGLSCQICPRKIEVLRERMKQEEFASSQRRRSQTEGRVSIMKWKFLGPVLRAKGFEARERATNWGVLAHNLWIVGRILVAEAQSRERDKGRAVA